MSLPVHFAASVSALKPWWRSVIRALCGLGVGFVLWAEPARAATLSEGENLAPAARAVSQLINCTPTGDGPALRVSAATRNVYCARMAAMSQRFLRRFEQLEKPLLNQVVPQGADLPVVYPFGGGDLLTALGTYPNAKEITTLSLEASGNVRAAANASKEKLEIALVQAGDNLRRLVAVEHSKTTNLSNLSQSPLPAEIVFSLYALHVWGFEPVGFRYFQIEPNGGLNYLTSADLQQRDLQAQRRVRLASLANIEVQYKRPGETIVRVFRHIAADLSDAQLKKDNRVLQHLRAKLKFLAMTKAASYLLWWDSFSMIRQTLADGAVFMISDSTGFPPAFAKAQGFSQTTYGQFHGPFLSQVNRQVGQAFIQLWQSQPHRPLPFRYGYPDRDRHGHMLVSKRETANR